MPQIPPEQLAEAQDVGLQRVADFLPKRGAEMDRRRGLLVPVQERAPRIEHLARQPRRLPMRFVGDALPEHLAGKDRPSDRRALEQPLEPANPKAMTRAMLLF